MASCIFVAYTRLILVGALPAVRGRHRLEHANFCALQAGKIAAPGPSAASNKSAV